MYSENKDFSQLDFEIAIFGHGPCASGTGTAAVRDGRLSESRSRKQRFQQTNNRDREFQS